MKPEGSRALQEQRRTAPQVLAQRARCMDAPSKSRQITLWVSSFFIGRYNGHEAGGFTSAARSRSTKYCCTPPDTSEAILKKEAKPSLVSLANT